MQIDYPGSLQRLLLHEGGYTNHPADPGGPTNFGITIYDARKYLNPNLSARPPWTEADLEYMRNMKVDDAKRVYKPKYWDAIRGDDLPAGVDDCVFDYGVNSGIGRAGKVLRRVLGLPDDTSIVDDAVVAAALKRPAVLTVDAVCQERMAFLHSLRTWPIFGGGWGRRVAEVKAFDDELATKALSLVASPNVAPVAAKAIDPDVHAQIRALQEKLAAAGYDPGAIDGDLGPKTVVAFQRSRGLHADGIEGPNTRPLLDAALAAAA